MCQDLSWSGSISGIGCRLVCSAVAESGWLASGSRGISYAFHISRFVWSFEAYKVNLIIFPPSFRFIKGNRSRLNANNTNSYLMFRY